MRLSREFSKEFNQNGPEWTDKYDAQSDAWDALLKVKG